jgi:hypothetical protein
LKQAALEKAALQRKVARLELSSLNPKVEDLLSLVQQRDAEVVSIALVGGLHLSTHT